MIAQVLHALVTVVMLAAGWQVSPDVWGHRGCWQLPGDTTSYVCADGFRDES